MFLKLGFKFSVYFTHKMHLSTTYSSVPSILNTIIFNKYPLQMPPTQQEVLHAYKIKLAGHSWLWKLISVIFEKSTGKYTHIE